MTSLKILRLANQMYSDRKKSMSGKYADYHGTDLYQEGKIVVSMLGAFTEETIRKVLREQKKDAKDADRLIEQAKEVRLRYNLIRRAKLTQESKQPADVYRKYARQYMEFTQSYRLNHKDDNNILQSMIKDGCTDEEMKLAICEASPVAAEPARDRQKYALLTVSKAKDLAGEQDQKAQVKRYYINHIEAIDNLNWKNRVYYDVKIIKELLQANYPETAVREVVGRYSTENAKTDRMIASAQRMLLREKKLLSEPKSIPKGMDYHSLKKLGVTAQDLYIDAVYERVQAYPSVRLSLSSRFIDVDAGEKLFSRYPDLDQSEFKEALKNCSPRMENVGLGTEDYPEMVCQKIGERRELLKKHQKETQVDVQKEYLRQCGLAAEGVNAEANLQIYHAGRAALKMLQRGMRPEEIFEAVVHGLEDMEQKQKEDCAKKILKKSQEVLKRLDRIQTAGQGQSRPPENAREFYLNALREKYDRKRYASSSMDVNIAAAMLLNKIKEEEICRALEENSPVAAEAGRDEQYLQYAVMQAKLKIEQEKVKLERYAIAPHAERNAKSKIEYARYLKELKETVDLPENLIAQIKDAEIAGILLKHYEKKEIETALRESPAREKHKEFYAKEIVKQAQRTLSKENALDAGRSKSLLLHGN